ncbi:hypothetical protein [Nostoc sp. FACHB-892]|nr:hypothetical protein [Nostoc sp. FACHB-892]
MGLIQDKRKNLQDNTETFSDRLLIQLWWRSISQKPVAQRQHLYS